MNLATPIAANLAGSANSAATNRPTLVPNTSGSAKGQPGERSVQLPQQLILRCCAGTDPAVPVRRPRRQLRYDFLPSGDRDAPAGQHQLGNCFKVDGVGLHPPPAGNPPPGAPHRPGPPPAPTPGGSSRTRPARTTGAGRHRSPTTRHNSSRHQRQPPRSTTTPEQQQQTRPTSEGGKRKGTPRNPSRDEEA